MNGVRIALCHGTFDVLHLGHVRFLQNARSMCDRLVVTVTADEFVNKGPGRPLFNEFERSEMIKALRCVSEVDICRDKTGIPMIEKYRPALYVKGKDYQTKDKHGQLSAEQEAVERVGGCLYIADLPGWSSTEIIERIREAG